MTTWYDTFKNATDPKPARYNVGDAFIIKFGAEPYVNLCMLCRFKGELAMQIIDTVNANTDIHESIQSGTTFSHCTWGGGNVDIPESIIKNMIGIDEQDFFMYVGPAWVNLQ